MLIIINVKNVPVPNFFMSSCIQVCLVFSGTHTGTVKIGLRNFEGDCYIYWLMLGFCPLASGSKGNALYLGTKKCKILIDAGLPAKVLQKRLADIGVQLEEIDGICITHEHSDHIRGLETLAEKWKIPIFANSDTAQSICSTLGILPKFKIFTTGETFEFGDIEIHPFSIQHDAIDP